MKRKFTRYPQVIKANRHIYSASDISDFEIDEDGVLIKYHGNATNVVIPDSVKKAGTNCFTGCDNLKSVKISKNLLTIPAYMFSQCPRLENINMADSIKKIDEYKNRLIMIDGLSIAMNEIIDIQVL